MLMLMSDTFSIISNSTQIKRPLIDSNSIWLNNSVSGVVLSGAVECFFDIKDVLMKLKIIAFIACAHLLPGCSRFPSLNDTAAIGSSNEIQRLMADCNSDDQKSCHELGISYYYGEGVEKDLTRAVDLEDIACNRGIAAACANLGLFYSDDKGIKKDYSKALLYFNRSCIGDSVSKGCNDLGVMYENGQGVDRDYFKAAELYQKACNFGFSLGCSNLASAYENGRGLKQDYAKALELYQKACDKHIAVGCYNLAVMYEKGEGVAQSTAKMLENYGKACDLKDQDGCDAYAKLNTSK